MDDTLLDAHDIEQRNINIFITCLKHIIDDSYTTSTDLQSLHAQKQAVLHRAQTVFQHKCAATWPQPSPLITITTPPHLSYHSKSRKWQLSLQIQTQSPSTSVHTPSHFALLAASPHCHIHTSPLPLLPPSSISNSNQPITLTSFFHITPDNSRHNDKNDGLIHMEVFILCMHPPSSLYNEGRSKESDNTNVIACPMYVGSVSLSWKEWIKTMSSCSGTTSDDNTTNQCSTKYMVMVTNNADGTTTTTTTTTTKALQHSVINALVNDLNFILSSTTTNEQQCYVLGAGVATATVMKCLHDDVVEVGDMATMVLNQDRTHRKQQQQQQRQKKYSVLKLEANSYEILDVICSEVDRSLLLAKSKEGKNWSWDDAMPKHSGGRQANDVLIKESECVVKWIEGMLQQQAVMAAATAANDGNGGILPGQLRDVVGVEGLQNDVIKAMMATNTVFQSDIDF